MYRVENTNPKAIAVDCHLHGACIATAADAHALAARVFVDHPEVSELVIIESAEIHPTGDVSLAGEWHSSTLGSVVGGHAIRRVVVRRSEIKNKIKNTLHLAGSMGSRVARKRGSRLDGAQGKEIMRTTISEAEYHLSPTYRHPRIERCTWPGMSDWAMVVLDDYAGVDRHECPVSHDEANEMLAQAGCTLADCRQS
jgi:hypothetical protein